MGFTVSNLSTIYALYCANSGSDLNVPGRYIGYWWYSCVEITYSEISITIFISSIAVHKLTTRTQLKYNLAKFNSGSKLN